MAAKNTQYSFDMNWTGHKIIQGDALTTLQTFPNEFFDAILTDPPYSSGGRTLSEKQRSTATKYLKTNSNLPNFEGDCKDQRSWTNWMTQWLKEAKRILKQGGVIGCFIDWRMLPSLTDAIQYADYCWRGIFTWDKGEGVRPQRGRFRSQCEYFVWGTKGDMPLHRNAPTLPGCIKVNTKTQNKRHQTEKPLELMYTIVQITERGGRVLDPFCGSGSTIIAAKHQGYSAIGIEINNEYCQIAQNRLSTELQPPQLDSSNRREENVN